MNKMNGTELAWTPRNYSTGQTCKTEGLDYKSLGELVLRAIAAGKITPPTFERRQCKETPLKLTICGSCGGNFEARRPTAKFCSNLCSDRAAKKRKRARKQLEHNALAGAQK